MAIDFSLWLFILTIASGLVALVDKLFFEKKRLAKFTGKLEGLNKKERHKLTKAPLLADYARSLFPVFLIVFALRSFVVEPFRIPSGSMLPTLQIGDFILVNKFSYGVRLPLSNDVLIKTGEPKTGDVLVFHFPVYPKVDFIKRVIGVPGDKLSYINKTLYINGKEMSKTFMKNVLQPANSITQKSKEYQESLRGVKHDIFTMSWRKDVSFKNVTVPKGEYFVMGDNRDNSEDSRYWGFVPEKDLVGKAFFVWFSWNADANSWFNMIRWNQIGTVL